MKVLMVVPGPDTHGVVRHALAVAALLRAAGGPVQVESVRTLDTGGWDADLTHMHFTDALYGGDIASAAAAFVQAAHRMPRPLVVTLHDVPGGGGDPDPERDRRRVAGYARVAAAADGVIVSGRHEVAGATAAAPAGPVWVIPLPVPEAAAGHAAPPDDPPSIAVLGFVYPGKGHAAAIEAAAHLDHPVQVRVLGAASPGHDDLLTALRRRADGLGVDLRVTGPLSDPDLRRAASGAGVPLAAYSTLGSSGSLATWFAAGRRPVAGSTAHTRELQAADPGCLRLLPLRHTLADLTQALQQALADPTTTWLDRPVRRRDTAAEHLAAFRQLLAAAGTARRVQPVASR